jgi:DNA-binding MarR family transcriptional regulator
MSQKELLQKLQIRQPSLVEFLVKLEHSGYIERRKNQDDKRITNVFLTDKVNESRKQVGVEREKMSRDLFCALTDEEQTALIVLLKKLVAAWTDEDV